MKYIAVMAQWKEDFIQAVEEHSGQADVFLVAPRPPGPYHFTCGNTTYMQVKNDFDLQCLRGRPLAGVLVSEEIRDVMSENQFNYFLEQLNRRISNETN